MSEPRPIAVYRRSVRASLERVWENVRDWEHLPWLHAGSFREIALEEAGDWGWRADVVLASDGTEPRVSGIELVIDDAHSRYVTRTVSGFGAGSEIRTQLDPRGAHETAIEVGFFVPGLPPENEEAVGSGYTRLYQRLWGEDEAMMIRREAECARPGPARAASRGPISLGSLDSLRMRLPHRVELAGRPFRIVEIEGELVAHSTRCPHRFGPLESSGSDPAQLRCPWHGYAFGLRDGRERSGRRMRLEGAPRVVVDPESSEVRLVWGDAERSS